MGYPYPCFCLCAFIWGRVREVYDDDEDDAQADDDARDRADVDDHNDVHCYGYARDLL